MCYVLRFAMFMAFGLASIFPSLIWAQNLDLAKDPNQFARAIRSSRLAYTEKLIPVRQGNSQSRVEILNKLKSSEEIIRRLEGKWIKDPKDKLAEVRKEKKRLLLRIKQLERLESILDNEDPDAISTAVKNAKAEKTKLIRQRNEMFQAGQRKLTDLGKRFATKNEEFTTALSSIFKEELKDVGEGFRRTSVACTYLAATAMVRYQDRNNRDIWISMNFQQDKKKTLSGKEQVLGRFPLSRKQERTLDFYVNDVLVNVSISPPNGQAVQKIDLERVFVAAVDIDQFAEQVSLASDEHLK